MNPRLSLLPVVAALGGAGIATAVAMPARASGTLPPLAAAAAAPTSACPATSGTVAGFGLTAEAAGYRYQVNSPGLLPFGDPNVGTIVETDVPYSRVTAEEGPVTDALASPAYPGDGPAHVGTLLATGGFPAGVVPNDPVLAEADYPPSPGHSASETWPAGGQGQSSAASTASEQGGTATSQIAPVPLGPVQSGSGDSTSTNSVQTSCASASATSHTGTITVAGLITIAGVTGQVSVGSNGTAAVPHAALTIGRVTVGGVDAYIDHSGIHLAPGQTVGGQQLQTVSDQLKKALAANAITFKVIEPTTQANGASASADSGGLLISFKQTLPAPPVPVTFPVPGLGTATISGPVPVINVVEYGEAMVSAAATAVPAFAPSSASSPPPGGGVIPGSVETPSGGGSDLGAPAALGSSGPGVVSSQQTPGGTSVYTSQPATIRRPPLGAAVPIGWILFGVFMSLVVSGPLLGYARWQLLEGRI